MDTLYSSSVRLTSIFPRLPHTTETVTTFVPRDWVQRSPWRQEAYLIEVHYKVKVQLILGLVLRNRRVPTFLRKNDGTSYGTWNAFEIKIRGRFRLRWPETETTIDARCTDEPWNVTFVKTFPRSFNDDPFGTCFARWRCVTLWDSVEFSSLRNLGVDFSRLNKGIANETTIGDYKLLSDCKFLSSSMRDCICCY